MSDYEEANYEEADYKEAESCFGGGLALMTGFLPQAQKTAGRPPSEYTLVVSQFKMMTKNSLKRYNLTTKLIRNHKKMIRLALLHIARGESNPNSRFIKDLDLGGPEKIKSVLHIIDEERSEDIEAWRRFVDICREDIAFFSEVSCTSFGLKNRRNAQDNQQKTMNSTFIRKYFANERTKQSFRAFLDYVFANRNEREYVIRFKALCCAGEHDSGCKDKWNSLYHILSFDMVEYW